MNCSKEEYNRSIRNFIHKAIDVNYRKRHGLKTWIMVIVFVVLSQIGTLSWMLILLDIIAVILTIVCTAIYRKNEKSQRLLFSALLVVVLTLLTTTLFLRLALWVGMSETALLLGITILAWIITVPTTYLVVKILLKKGYYLKHRKNKLEGFGAVGGGGIGLIMFYKFGTAGLPIVLIGVTAFFMSLATTCAMRLYDIHCLRVQELEL